MRAFSSRRCRPVLALAVIALGACGDHTTPTAAAPELRAHALIDDSGDEPPPDEPPLITELSTSTSTLTIGGPPATFAASLYNPGTSRFNLSLAGVVRQGTARRGAGSAAIACGGGAGVVPAGATCSVSGVFVASNTTSGSGTLGAGLATFELQLRDEYGVVLATRSRAVTLVGHAKITALTLSSTSFVINGPSVPYTAIVENSGVSLPGVSIQGWIKQGTVRHAANGKVIACGSGTGVLPPGTCTVSFSAAAFDYGSLPPLVPGAATFELELIDYARDPDAVLHTWVIPVTLLAPAKITAVTMSSPSFVLQGPVVRYTVGIENSAVSPLQKVFVRSWINQHGNRVVLSYQPVFCGSGSGVLPPGTCTISQGASAFTSSGSFPLVPGGATFEVELLDGDKSPILVMHTWAVPVTLLAPTATAGQF